MDYNRYLRRIQLSSAFDNLLLLFMYRFTTRFLRFFLLILALFKPGLQNQVVCTHVHFFVQSSVYRMSRSQSHISGGRESFTHLADRQVCYDDRQVRLTDRQVRLADRQVLWLTDRYVWLIVRYAWLTDRFVWLTERYSWLLPCSLSVFYCFFPLVI
jgi:hypothetical protein